MGLKEYALGNYVDAKLALTEKYLREEDELPKATIIDLGRETFDVLLRPPLDKAWGAPSWSEQSANRGVQLSFINDNEETLAIINLSTQNARSFSDFDPNKWILNTRLVTTLDWEKHQVSGFQAFEPGTDQTLKEIDLENRNNQLRICRVLRAALGAPMGKRLVYTLGQDFK